MSRRDRFLLFFAAGASSAMSIGLMGDGQSVAAAGAATAAIVLLFIGGRR